MDGIWLPLGPTATDGLPEDEGVFVLGSLVRSILLVGASDGRGLRSAVTEAVARGPLAHRARCVRIEACPDPRARQTELLDEYRRDHGGALPPDQPAVAPALRAVPGTARRPKTAELDRPHGAPPAATGSVGEPGPTSRDRAIG